MMQLTRIICFILLACIQLNVHAQEFPINSEKQSEIQNLIDNAINFFEQDNIEDTIKNLELALDTYEINFKENSPLKVSILNDLGFVYKESNKIEESLKYYLLANEVTKLIGVKRDKEYVIRLNTIIDLYKEANQYLKAIPIAKEIISFYKDEFGTEHIDYGISLNELAVLYDYSEQYDKALPLYKNALGFIEKTLGNDSTEYSIILNNIANLYLSTQKYDDAILLYPQILDIREKNNGKKNIEYITSLIDFTTAYKQSGKNDKALSLYLEGLDLIKKTLGNQDPKYIFCLKNIVSTYYDLEKYDKIIPLANELLTLTDKTIGQDTYEYRSVMSDLSIAYLRKGDINKGFNLFENLLEKTKIFDSDEYSLRLQLIGLSARNYGLELIIAKDYNKALSLYTKLDKLNYKHYGNEYPNYESILENKARVYENLNEFDKALEIQNNLLTHIRKENNSENLRLKLIDIANLLELKEDYKSAFDVRNEILEISEKNQNDTLSYSADLNNLGLLHQNMQNYSDAESLFNKAIKITIDTNGEDNLNYIIQSTNLATLYRETERYNEALILYKSIIEKTKKVLKKNDSQLITCLNGLALTYNYLGQYNNAISTYKKVKEHIAIHLGKDYSEYSNSLYQLANLQVNTGNNKEALPIYIEALELAKQNINKDNTEYIVALQNLAYYYEVTEDYDKVITQLEKAHTLTKEFANIKPGIYFDNIILLTRAHYIKSDLSKKGNILLKTIEDFIKKSNNKEFLNINRLTTLAELYTMSFLNKNKALVIYEDILNKTEYKYGKEHPYYGESLTKLGNYYLYVSSNSVNENYKKALPLFLEALKNAEQSFGKNHYIYNNRKITLADLYTNKSKFDEALLLYVESLKYTEQSLGKNHPEYGDLQLKLADFYKKRRDYKQALPLYLEALENAKQNFGKSHYLYSQRREKLAFLYQITDQHKDAVPLRKEALIATELKFGKNSKKYREAAHQLAYLHTRLKNYNDALSLHKNALQSAKREVGIGHNYYKENLEKLADFYWEFNRNYNSVIPLYTEILDHRKQTLNQEKKQNTLSKTTPFSLWQFRFNDEDNQKKYLSSLQDIVKLYNQMDQQNKSIELLNNNLLYVEKILSKQSTLYIYTLLDLSKLYYGMNKKSKAQSIQKLLYPLAKDTFKTKNKDYYEFIEALVEDFIFESNYEEALNISYESLKSLESTTDNINKKSIRIEILQNIFGVYRNLGYDNHALKFLELINKSYNKNIEDYGYRSNCRDLAHVYKRLGFIDKAISKYLEVINFNNIKNKADLEEKLSSLRSLAEIYTEKKDYKKALDFTTKAIDVSEKYDGKEESNDVKRLIDLANLQKETKNYEDAITTYKKALEKYNTLLIKGDYQYIKILKESAELNKTLGNHDKTLALYKEITDYLKKEKIYTDIAELQYYNKVMLANESLGDYPAALSLMKENNAFLENKLNSVFSYSDEKGKERFIKEDVGSTINQFTNFNFLTQSKYNEAQELALNNILTYKGLILNASKGFVKELQNLNDNSTNQLLKKFINQRQYIDKQLQLPVSYRTPDFGKELSRHENIKRDLIGIHKTHYGDTLNYTKDWKNTRLKTNEIAIEFTNFKVHNKQWKDSIMYVAYLYKKDWDTPKVVNLFEEKQLKKYITNTTSPNKLYKTRGAVGNSTSNTAIIADSIYNLVWKPLEKHLKSVKTVYYSPDGLLHTIPFSALPNNENKLLAEVYVLHQTGNTADIRIDNKTPNLSDVVIIGGINYDYTPSNDAIAIEERQYFFKEAQQIIGKVERTAKKRKDKWSYLEGTLKEVNRIKELLPESKILINKEATESAFKALSENSPSVLHIATHGFFFQGNDDKKQTLSTNNRNLKSIENNPLFRSGLIFSNANYAWQNGFNPYEKDDGILTAYEISNLDLSKTDIVILSACETGLGDIEGSEGVYGLQRAFKMAGVKTIIMTLWEVPDAETAEFMDLFYTKWKDINNAKLAFKKTQGVMMNKYRENPEKWAAFVLIY